MVQFGTGEKILLVHLKLTADLSILSIALELAKSLSQEETANIESIVKNLSWLHRTGELIFFNSPALQRLEPPDYSSSCRLQSLLSFHH